MIEAVNILAISNKGRSRIGRKLITAIVEQRYHDKIFTVINSSQCMWVKLISDPDYRIIPDD